MKFATVLALAWLVSASAWAQTPSATDSEYLQRLEERLKKLEAARDRAAEEPPGPSNRFNPAISVNGLFLGTYASEGSAGASEIDTGMDIQEVELRFSADVDHWLRAELTLAMEETDEIEIEELIAEAVIARSLSLRAGKFFAAFGKHNLLHTHSYPFIDRPIVNEEILGSEGLNEGGAGLDYLLPLPFFSSLSLQFLQGDNDLFSGPRNDDFLYLLHWKNLVDLTADLTAELGGSYATGRNDNPVAESDRTHLAGADLTFKWKPAGRERYRSLVWQSEFMDVSGVAEARGVYSLLQYQFAQRWWVQGRYDYYTRDDVLETADRQRGSALLAFAPSEFTALRLQYNYLDPRPGKTDHQVLLQINFTLGSHPAHAY